VFTITYRVKLADTDASGLLFFGSQFRIAHDAFEAFAHSSGLSVGEVLRERDFLLPIVHAEANYLAPSAVGDELRIEVRAERVGDSSFTLAYRLISPHGHDVGTVRIVHAAIDKKTRLKRSLPDDLRARLQEHLG
jgi:1,4-dihydroxy-2-naphthoyl-CoA hydrolase